MLPPLTVANPETIAYLRALVDDETDYQADMQQARQYDAGQQFVALTDRLRTFLGGNASDSAADWKRLRLNICRIVLSAVVDKLIVHGFDSDEPARTVVAPDGTPQTVKPVAAWAWRLWQLNRMDAKQRRVHKMTLRDSEAFVLVDWDLTTGRPRFTPHQRYIDASVGGDSDGCRAFYRNDDPDQDLLFVSKRWTEVIYAAGRRQTRRRLTVYYPDRIEKYAGVIGAEKPTVDADNEPWPIPWRHADGTPMGIPAIHFRSSAGMEACDAWPIQNAINKAFVDLMAESDMAAFRILLAFGWTPVDKNGNPLAIEPGTWLGSEKPDATVQEIAGADLSQFMNVIEGFMFWAATVTDTPASRFITTKAIAAEGTQKEQGAPLLNKARNRAGELGDAWENVLSIARRLQNTFGTGPALDETPQLSAVWAPLEVRDKKAELEQAVIRKALGMPIRLVAKGLDLTQDEISAWVAEVELRASVAAAAFGGDAQPQGDAAV